MEFSVAIPEDWVCLRVGNADLGSAIRHLRRARRLTIEDLAWRAGMHATYLSGIERGTRNPTWRKLADIAGALEAPISLIVLAAEKYRVEEAIRLAIVDAVRAAPRRQRAPPPGA